jgi:hypothetical protein
MAFSEEAKRQAAIAYAEQIADYYQKYDDSRFVNENGTLYLKVAPAEMTTIIECVIEMVADAYLLAAAQKTLKGD